MKQTLILLAALTVSTLTFAQKPDGCPPGCQRQGKGKGQGRAMHQPPMKQLNLTDAQQSKMKEVNASFQAEMKKIRENEKQTVKAQRDAMYKLTQKHKADIKQLLTPEQQQKLVTLREENRKQMEQKQSARFDKMAADLKLTEAQKAQLTQEREKNRASMHAIMENASLDRTAREEKIKALREQHKKEMEKVLNEEQMKQWEEWQKKHMQKGPRMQGHPWQGAV